MITKERLEELIEQGATIYEAKYNHIEAVDLSKRKLDFISEKYNMVRFEPEINERWKHHKYFDKLFETEEDARWELEMTETRTETLKLPTWEEFTKERDMEEFGFYSKYHKYTTLKVISDKYLAVEDNWERYYTGELTKENYIEACKLCKKLFKGEEV